MDQVNRLLKSKQALQWIPRLLLAADALLCALVIWKVPCRLPNAQEPHHLANAFGRHRD
jgi:hypothetical protein